MNNGFLRREDHCLTAEDNQVKGKTCFYDVNDNDEGHDDYDVEQQKLAQLWKHSKGGSIKNLATETCITTKGLKSGDRIALAPCDPNDFHQIWWFQKYTDITVL
ncbi:polypeptide N-acetylgalactosaminyltransferase 13-like protein [Leptotrombidium deliense]|uniref:Polypeptide N-acetylgalactosaminyltransferase 13-like protein n=1 Tax=Leptotrombidium deliense TaxID=299467 RepID=A0A443S6J6_9ACAR|nr:polypeptide N-acetylgalactosaminyltransferase 13-like protein [Leptotrombidium deliense]